MSSTPKGIIKRYKTYYGSQTTVICWMYPKADETEKKFKERFIQEHLELELYDARYLMSYISWITETTRTSPYVCTGNIMPSSDTTTKERVGVLTRQQKNKL